jgi:hypothetical protein
MWCVRSNRRFLQGGRGVTLIETLISSALFAFVITGVYAVYTTMQGTMIMGETKSDLQQNARIGLGRMLSEIRTAGNDPSGAIGSVVLQPKAAIRAATGGCLTFIAPDENGTSSKQITYDMYTTTSAPYRTILRRYEQAWSPNNFVENENIVPQEYAEISLLSFVYYDAYNKLLTPEAWTSTQQCPPKLGAASAARTQLSYWQMRQVRRIAVVLRTRHVKSGSDTENYTLSGDVYLRNR